MSASISRTEQYIIACLFVLFLGASLLRIYTEQPLGDEAYFATPAYNLIWHGYMGASNLDASNPIQTGINDHSYWTVPLYFLLTAGWYKLVGFGLFRARILPLLFSSGGLIALFYVARKLTNSFQVAWVASGLTGLMFLYIWSAAINRMDSACAAFGLAGLAVYLCNRERNLSRAIFLSQLLVAASGMTHPAGLLYFLALAFLTLYYDRRRIRVSQLLLGAVPYLVGGLAWWLYIRQDPQQFITQFMGSVNYHHLSVFSLANVKAEILDRYLNYFGLYGASGFTRLRCFQLLAYSCAIVLAFSMARIRDAEGTRLSGVLLLIMCVGLAFIDGIKSKIYLVHIIPWLSLLLAIAAVRLVEAKIIPLPVMAAALSALVAIQLIGVAYIASQDSLRTRFLPATDYLRANAPEPQRIFGSSELGFEIGFGSRLMDDPTLGFWSGKRADMVVVDTNWSLVHWPSMQPADGRFAHVQAVLSGCRLSYQGPGYMIYRCN